MVERWKVTVSSRTRQGDVRIRKGYIESLFIIAESVHDSWDLASYIKAGRGPAGSSLIISYNHAYTKP
jgi:hypothetical protein